MLFLVIPCDNVPDIRNGMRWPSENSVSCGTKVQYICDQGYSLEGDIPECGVGGQFQGQVPVCKKRGNFCLVNINTVRVVI